MTDAVVAVCVAVRDALRDLTPGDGVLVACSGGPDSLALAAAVARLSGRYGWRASSLTVDHGWSAAASAASAQAVTGCRALGLEAELVAVRPDGVGGPEGAARTARYAALDEAAGRLGVRAVLLGHTRDDQAETVLLGLARGSGARSLAGMAARRGVYRRPFLTLARETTVAACAELGLTPWLDPANEDPAYLRVRVRRLADALEAALGPGVAAALARSADLLRDDADALDQYAELLANQAQDDAGLAVDTLVAAPPAVRRRALLSAARAAGSPAGALGHRHAQALDALLSGAGGAGADLPGGVRAVRRGPLVVFERGVGN
jgi:tRNA(Ile)-lysidine synthase